MNRHANPPPLRSRNVYRRDEHCGSSGRSIGQAFGDSFKQTETSDGERVDGVELFVWVDGIWG